MASRVSKVAGLVGLPVAGLLAVACGSSNAGSPGSAQGSSSGSVASQVQTIEGTLEGGIASEEALIRSDPSNAIQYVGVIGTDFESASSALAAIKYPTSAKADAISAESALSAAAASASPTEPRAAATNAAAAVNPALTTLNTDLGLPAYPNGIQPINS